MLKKLLPKQNNFFQLFQKTSDHLVGAAEQFLLLIKHLDGAEQYAKVIADHEISADNCAKATFDLLHKTFITPFDRHDIHQLTRKLDDILDMINRTTQRIALYQIRTLPEDIQRIAVLALEATRAIRTAIKELENLKNATDIVKICRAINDASGEAEEIMLHGLGHLFNETEDFKYLLKTKEIYEYSTYIVRECHGIADIIKGIVLEYS